MTLGNATFAPTLERRYNILLIFIGSGLGKLHTGALKKLRNFCHSKYYERAVEEKVLSSIEQRVPNNI